MSDAVDHEFDLTQAGDHASVGAILRGGREARRLTLERVARELHLPVHILRALERDDYAALPPAAFIRGYIRSYARLLDLPEQALVDAYNRAEGEGEAPEIRPVERDPGEARSLSWKGPLGLILLVMTGIWAYQSWNTPPVTERVQVPPGYSDRSESAQTEPSRGSEGAVVPSGTALPLATSAPMPGVNAGLGTESTQANASALPEPVSEPASSGRDTLVLNFAGESWASVVDAEGTRLLHQTVNKGQSKTVQGKAPFKITLGRPADTRLELNGKAYDHGFVSNRSAVRFSVPRDGSR